MFLERLSSYKISVFDDLLKNHPFFQDLTLTERISIYNKAQEELLELFNIVHQIHNVSIVDNTIIYEPVDPDDDYILTVLSEGTKRGIRLSTRTLRDLDFALNKRDELKKYVEANRYSIYNLAQQAINKIRSSYGAYDYRLFYKYGEIVYELTDSETDIEAFTSLAYLIATKYFSEYDIEPEVALSYAKGRIKAALEFSSAPLLDLAYSVKSSVSYEKEFNIEAFTSIDHSVFVPVITPLSYDYEPVMSLDYNVITPTLEEYDYEPVTTISYSVA